MIPFLKRNTMIYLEFLVHFSVWNEIISWNKRNNILITYRQLIRKQVDKRGDFSHLENFFHYLEPLCGFTQQIAMMAIGYQFFKSLVFGVWTISFFATFLSKEVLKGEKYYPNSEKSPLLWTCFLIHFDILSKNLNWHQISQFFFQGKASRAWVQ